jgi:hypothetical protein
MTDTAKTNLTVKKVHFPKMILVAAATLWGLGIVGAVLEMVFAG